MGRCTPSMHEQLQPNCTEAGTAGREAAASHDRKYLIQQPEVQRLHVPVAA